MFQLNVYVKWSLLVDFINGPLFCVNATVVLLFYRSLIRSSSILFLKYVLYKIWNNFLYDILDICLSQSRLGPLSNTTNTEPTMIFNQTKTFIKLLSRMS